ncbi:nucleotidyltransferase family protein [Tateyamaria sp.]|uniref:nucleotidyltransferase family protein n=1 Tax=Tateyamaria sp. TaxID=1929288 RepID=UPI003B21F534
MMPIILLAAGSSSRMRGRDKLREEVGGTPLLRRQASIARQVSDHVIVALPPHPHPRYDLVADLDITAQEIPDAAEGMGASIRTAVATLPADATHVMVLLADMPEISEHDLRKVQNSVATHPDTLIWRGATQDDKPGHPIVFDASLFAQLTRLTGDSGGQAVVKAAGNRVHLVPLKGQTARLDLDTPEAWAAWRAGQTPI